MKFAREMGRPLVATADVHYLRREDYHHHAALLCVQTKSTLAQPKMSFDTNEFYLKSSEEMAAVVRRLPGGARLDAGDRRALRRVDRAGRPAHPELRDAERRVRARPPARARRRRAAPALRRPGPGGGARARRHGARRHRQDGLQRLLPDRLGLRRLREGQRDRGRPGPRLGGRLDRRLLPGDHGRRPAPLRPAVRALPERRARVDAGHRHRLLGARPGARDPLRDGRSTAPTAWRRSSPSARCSRARRRATPPACSATSTRSATGSRS